MGCAASPSRVTRPKLQRATGSRSTTRIFNPAVRNTNPFRARQQNPPSFRFPAPWRIGFREHPGSEASAAVLFHGLTMGRRRKAGPRTKTVRPARAYRASPAIPGQQEGIAKRTVLINGADPALAASASGILLANGFLTGDQHRAAMAYSWAHAHDVRPALEPCLLDDGRGHEAPDELLGGGQGAAGGDGRRAVARAAPGGRQCRGVRLRAEFS